MGSKWLSWFQRRSTTLGVTRPQERYPRLLCVLWYDTRVVRWDPPSDGRRIRACFSSLISFKGKGGYRGEGGQEHLHPPPPYPPRPVPSPYTGGFLAPKEEYNVCIQANVRMSVVWKSNISERTCILFQYYTCMSRLAFPKQFSSSAF